jgi:plastocyanin
MKRTHALRALGAFGAIIAGATPLRAVAGAPRTLTLHVYSNRNHGRVGPDHKRHDSFFPADFTIAANTPVRITVINECAAPHSITCAAIPIDQEITPARFGKNGAIIPVATTFTVNVRPGTYRWYCKEPCDMAGNMWSMTPGDTGRGQEGYMAGHITAV